MTTIIRVSSSSSVPSTATCIANSILDGKEVQVRAIGAAAVNQLYKSIAVARGTLASKGKDLYIKPGFDDTVENGEKRTIMVAYCVVR